jgi:NAD(P)-dependent dehydrogenase (short-subunit alcohol dehydrogenase family)
MEGSMAKEKWTVKNIGNMNGKVVIITGANSGIGFEASKALLAKGATVIMACRNLTKAQNALHEIQTELMNADARIMQLDLASQESITKFTRAFKSEYNRLDILMNNAGIMSVPYGLTKDGFERQLGTNHLGLFVLTGQLLDFIKGTPNSRVVTMSSGAHAMANINFDNLQYDHGSGYNASFAYGRSKLANLLFTYQLQRYFEKEKINAISLAAHPGGANTNLNNHLKKGLFAKITTPLMTRMFQSAAMGALPILRAATDPLAKGGQYYGPDSFTGNSGYPVIVKSSKRSHNTEFQRKLWEVSEKLTGIIYS